MKRFFSILWQVVTWIGAIYIELMATAIIYIVVDTYMYHAYDNWALWTVTDHSLYLTVFIVITFLFIAGLYICVLSFNYAYRRNKWIQPYRLLVRRIVSMSTLLLSVFQMFLLSLFVYENISFYIRRLCIATSHMLLMLCAWIAVPTLCIYVFINSRPDKYQKKFLTEEFDNQPMN